MISGIQIRAARALLAWDQGKLAEASGVSLITIKRLEAAGDDLQAQFTTVMKVKEALESAGVLFISAESGMGYGVRLQPKPNKRARRIKG
ncbi:MAG TPA: transcriptional regulator [Alphaproteobacteria bacterium]|nr:transcriptional regulator [Alphaproteobacteria bacterium]